jgi:predicted GNAT family acetyltransferase
MRSRISTGLRGRLHQAWQITKWYHPKLSTIQAEECVVARRVCPMLFMSLDSAMTDLPSHEVGMLYAVLHKAAMAMVMFITDDIGMDNAITELQRWIQVCCPNTAISESSLVALWAFTRTMIIQEGATWPPYLTALINRHAPNQTFKQWRRLVQMNHVVAMRVSNTFFRATLPQLRARYSSSEMIGFISAHRREYLFYDDSLPWPFVNMARVGMAPAGMVQYTANNTETEYRAVGERVAPWKFCSPTVARCDTDCSICMSIIFPEGSIQNVTTKCGHLFHWMCLDRWVNESGMKTSNTCPTCRTVLCRPRQRVHISMDSSFDFDL